MMVRRSPSVVDDEGGVEISINPPPAKEPGNGVEIEVEVERSRAYGTPPSGATMPGVRERLHVSANPDDSITIDVTEAARQLVVLGDPKSNVITIGEVPMPADQNAGPGVNVYSIREPLGAWACR